MKKTSIVFTGKEQLEVIEEEVTPLKAGQLRTETTRTMISTGTESIVYLRNFAPGTHWDAWVKYPFHCGYLNVGRVVEIAPDVTDWKVGDRVASRGPHTSLVVVAAPAATRIPDNVADDEAVWMGIAKICQVGVRVAEHRLGDAVVVIGLGLLGQMVVQYLRLSGASEVIAIDVSQKRLDMAARHGATRTLKMTAAEALKTVQGLTGGAGADVVYDVTGHPAVLPTALPLARRFGAVILLGDAGNPSLQTLTPDVIKRGIRILGAHDGYTGSMPNPCGRWSAAEMHDLFMAYLSRGQMSFKDLNTHHYAPRDARQAYTMLQTDRENAMAVLFDWK